MLGKGAFVVARYGHNPARNLVPVVLVAAYRRVDAKVDGQVLAHGGGDDRVAVKRVLGGVGGGRVGVKNGLVGQNVVEREAVALYLQALPGLGAPAVGGLGQAGIKAVVFKA